MHTKYDSFFIFVTILLFDQTGDEQWKFLSAQMESLGKNNKHSHSDDDTKFVCTIYSYHYKYVHDIQLLSRLLFVTLNDKNARFDGNSAFLVNMPQIGWHKWSRVERSFLSFLSSLDVRVEKGKGRRGLINSRDRFCARAN